MPNFNEIANKKLADVERPPLPPTGHYKWMVTKIPDISERSGGAFTNISFPVKAIEAYENVDAEELSKFGGLKNVTGVIQFLYDNEDDTKGARTQFQIRQFLEKHLQIEGAEGMQLTQAMNAAVNHQCDGEMGWRPDKNDKELFYPEIRKTAPVRE